MTKRNWLTGLLVAVLSVGGVATAAAAASSDRTLSGSLQASNVVSVSGPFMFIEAGTMSLKLAPGPAMTGSYTLNYNRILSTPDYAVGTFTLTVKGATLTGDILSTNYVSCQQDQGSLLCMDVVIGPLTVSGHGPLGRFKGGALTLRRDIFNVPSDPTNMHRTVTGQVEGTLCGTTGAC
jgi:hypothetical protein